MKFTHRGDYLVPVPRNFFFFFFFSIAFVLVETLIDGTKTNQEEIMSWTQNTVIRESLCWRWTGSFCPFIYGNVKKKNFFSFNTLLALFFFFFTPYSKVATLSLCLEEPFNRNYVSSLRDN